MQKNYPVAQGAFCYCRLAAEWGSLMVVTRVLDRKIFFAGQLVFKEGEPGDRAFLVQSGLVEIIKGSPHLSGDAILGEIGPGGIFGEMALIDNRPRMASARAREDTTVVVIGYDQFHAKLDHADPFIRALLNLFVSNIRDMADRGLFFS
ncbi:MAG: cyclic nucleotide-binding domain-containing protein [Alphaproteobacteria bacterium]